MHNPFRNRIVSDPWTAWEAEVPEINSEAAQLCRDALEIVRNRKRSVSVLLTGATGSGKTHLLSRIRRTVADMNPTGIFCAVRLHTGPNRFWRHFRKQLVESLEQPLRGNRSQLERIFLRRLYLLCRKPAVYRQELGELENQIRCQSDISPALITVCRNLVLKNRVADTLAWLRGHSISDALLAETGLPGPPETPEEAEEQSRYLIQEIFRLAGPDISVVLCFDQIEALQRYPRDDAGLFIFGQAVRTLHNETRNLLIITCVQTLFLDQLKNAIVTADFHGMSDFIKGLDHLPPDKARMLIVTRMNSAGLPEHRQMEFLKYLESGLLPSLAEENKTAREILTLAAERFDEWLRGVDPEGRPFLRKSDEGFLEEELARREEKARKKTTPDDLDEIVQGAVPLLCHVRDGDCRESDGSRPGDIDMVLHCGPDTVFVSLCNQRNLNSLAARLRRLASGSDPKIQRKLVLLRHAERRIPASAKKVNEYIRKLSRRGACWITPSRETLAVLEAIRSLLAEAKGGDLNNDGRSITEPTVREWIRNAASDTAWEFVESLMQKTEREAPHISDTLLTLVEILKANRFLWVSEAASQLQTDPDLLMSWIGPETRSIGILNGPPPLLFHRIF